MSFTALIYDEPVEVDQRLLRFNVGRRELIEVVKNVVAARADAVADDPLSAEGLFAYIYGTRSLRALFGRKGWIRDRKDNVESVRHPDRHLKIVYQSVDLAACRDHDPRAIHAKGSGSDRAVHLGQADLFEDRVIAPIKIAPIDVGVWFFCVSVDGDDVRAELALPAAIEGGNFKGFLERIFIVSDGDWSSVHVSDDVLPDAVEFEPAVTRK